MIIKIDDVFEFEFYVSLKKRFSIITRLKIFHGDKIPYYNKKPKCRERIVSLVNWKVITTTYDLDYTKTFIIEHNRFRETLDEIYREYGENFDDETFIITELMKRTHYKIPVNVVRSYISDF